MSVNNLQKPKRTICTIVLFCFVLTQVVSGVFFYARPAEAQMVVTDPITSTQTTIKNIKDFLKILVINAGTMALINAASRFAQKIAYDLAVGIASGGKGQMPLFSTDGWGDYMANSGLDAAGEFIGSFGEMVGVNFCAPPNPRLGLSLQLKLAQTYAEGLPPPSCEWSAIQSNWESFISEVQTEDFLREAASQFQIGYGAGTDLDLAVSTYVGAFNAEQGARDVALLTREEGKGFKSVEEFISGKVKTPAEVIREASLGMVKDPKMAEEQKQAMMSQALAAGGTQILTMFASTFVSTLLSKTMERIFSKGMVSLADLFPKGEDATSKEGTAWGGRRAAELAFADLLVPQIKEGGAYDILSDFIVCPEKFKGVNNCVMDGKFEAAVRRAQTGEPLTVREAMESPPNGEGLLNGDWPLIPPSDLAKNQDPYCYTYGYCYSNLVKLRKARVIPIGWEIAAQSNTSTNYVKLKEVVDRFRDCNAAGEADTEHPYCHLIDPSWILKAPAEQCRARVYGPLLQTTENSFRQEICVDSPTCIAEDDQGNCEGGWGYCTREKNIWRLDGDKCDAQYDTCRLLRRSDGQNVAYVTNTVDYGPPCAADDIGCRWYSDRQSKVGDEWVWQDTLTGLGTAARRSDRIFFNKNITQCDEPGCNEFLRTTADTRLNLVANSSFENFTGTIDDGTEDTFASWTKEYTPSVPPQSVSGTYFGNAALRSQSVISQIVHLDKERGGKTFTLSLFSKGCRDSSRFGFDVSDRVRDNPSPSETSWQRYSTTITFPDTDASKTISIKLYNVDMNASSPCLTDAVQLEEGAFASQYHEGWGRTGEALYLKTAPDYYSCYDYTTTGALNKTNDAEQCANFSKACEEKDVGCEEYRPTNGDPSVPGVANYPDDYCPDECVGYQTFKQVETDFEQEKFPVYFIPATGRTCSAADMGCDQFTSLETEAVANFNYVRRCEKPGATSESFYTWEGSDTTGYQLKTWSLKVGANYDPADPARLYSPGGGTGPCTKLDPINPAVCADDGVTGVCTKADTLTNPDCREFYDAAGKKHYRLYSKTIVATDDCHPYRKTISSATDCGTSGGRWDTVKSECIYQIYLPESRSCQNDAVGCRAYRGNAGANTALLFSDNFDDGTPGGTSSDWDVGTISSESLVVGGKSLSLPAGAETTKDVSSLVRKGGIYTLSFWAKGNGRLDIKFGSAASGKEFSSATLNPTNLSFDWRYFSLGPIYLNWDPAAVETLEIATVGGTSPTYLDNIILREIQSYIYVVKNSWTTPISCDRSFSIDTSIADATVCATSGGSWSADRNECVLSAILPQAQLGCQSYYDRANGLHYLKSFSRLCSPDVAGCEKLIKTGNTSAATLENFNTENDVNNPATLAIDETQGLSAEERLSDNVTIPADSFAYIVVNDTYKCAAQNKGCAEFGSPTLDQTGNVKVGEDGKAQYDTVNLLANPALYNSTTGRILCQVGFQGCEEYTTTEGGKLYFKNPEPRLCEWKDNVSISGQNVSGWFKKQEKAGDPLEACDPANFNGGYYNIWKNGDASCTLPYVCQDAPGGADIDGGGDGFCACSVPTTETPSPGRKPGTTCNVSYGKRSCPYSGWVGECVPQADRCTKFVDPVDTTNDPLGAAYYYVKNDKLSSGNCNGMVSQRDGCILFNDTSNPQLNKNADATYRASEDLTGDPGGLVAPIDCQTSDSCKRCFRPSPGGAPPFRLGDYCQQSTDCPSGYTCTVMNDIYSFLLSRGVAERTDIVIDELMPGKVFKLNNANILYQVRRDRVCGEWLTCSGTTSTFDPQTGRQKTLCDAVSSCREYAKVGQATAQCTRQLDSSEVETSRKILNKNLYVSRDVTFKGMDYSGDSIYNQYQAPDLHSVNIGTEETPIPALAFIEDRCFDDTVTGGRAVPCSTHPPGFCDSEINGSGCGNNGKCFNNVCITNFRNDPFVPGAVLALNNESTEFISCRAYPEQSSPFPNSVVKTFSPLSKQPGFTGANVCEDGEDCNCSYKKASYGSGAVIKYFDKDNTSIDKICVGGKNAGKTCLDDVFCRDGGGSCNSAEREDAVLGWNGYCLERDTSTSINGDPDQFACLTWYPIDQLPGMPDLYNNYPRAGFSLTNMNYCLAPAPYKILLTNPTSGGYCASLGPLAGLAHVSGPLGCDSDQWCDGEIGETQNAFNCGYDGRQFCNDEGRCCDISKEWVFLAPCESNDLCTDYTWNRAPFRCVPKNSKHEDGSICNPSTLGDLIRAVRNVDGEPGDDYYVLSNFTDSPDRVDINDFNDCQKEGVDSSYITANSYLGCKATAKVSTGLEDTDSNKAWTDRVWNFSGSERTSTPYEFSTPFSSINYVYNTVRDPFGYASPPSDVNLKIPTCLKTDNRALNLPVGPIADNVCPPGYALSPLTQNADGTVRNESRPYLWVGQPETPPVVVSCPYEGGDQACNPGINCVNYKCYKSCNPLASPSTCPGGEACHTDGYCPGTERDITGADIVARERNCRAAQGSTQIAVLGTCNNGSFVGERCESDRTCWLSVCSGAGVGGAVFDGECLAIGGTPPSRVRIEESGVLTKAKDRLKQIFAKSYGVFKIWDMKADSSSYAAIDKLGAYRDFTDSDYTASERTAIDITAKTDPSIPASAWPLPPQVWPITDCRGEKCKPLMREGDRGISGISINGVDGTGFTPTGSTEPINAVGYGGQLVATMQFFGTADKNAGPLRKIIKDWNDDSTPVTSEGRYKNHLGREACNNSDFAHSADACAEDYFYSTHTYTCPINASTAVRDCTSDIITNCFADICPEDVNGGLAGNGSCCVFKPRVQIKDNWGWCNGTCPGGAGPTSNGCYSANPTGGECETEEPGKDPWTYFMGQVIVVPK